MSLIHLIPNQIIQVKEPQYVHEIYFFKFRILIRTLFLSSHNGVLEARGGTRVHHGRVGSAGLCDLKILHPWRRLKKGVKILQWPPQR